MARSCALEAAEARPGVGPDRRVCRVGDAKTGDDDIREEESPFTDVIVTRLRVTDTTNTAIGTNARASLSRLEGTGPGHAGIRAQGCAELEATGFSLMGLATGIEVENEQSRMRLHDGRVDHGAGIGADVPVGFDPSPLLVRVIYAPLGPWLTRH